MARELKTGADIIFMPYNYLLDAKVSRTMSFFFNPWCTHFEQIMCLMSSLTASKIHSSNFFLFLTEIDSLVDLLNLVCHTFCETLIKGFFSFFWFLFFAVKKGQ